MIKAVQTESKFPFNWQRVFYWSRAAMLELLANVH